MLASLLYPFDDDAAGLIGGWLDELERHGHVRRYLVEDSTYLDIPKWLKHQKIDHPGKSRLPAFSETFARPSRSLANGSRIVATDLGPRNLEESSEEVRKDSLSHRLVGEKGMG
jgi:hypothetical protein